MFDRLEKAFSLHGFCTTSASKYVQKRIKTHVGTEVENKKPLENKGLMVGAQGIEPWTSPV
jgi:hypothetical protein